MINRVLNIMFILCILSKRFKSFEFCIVSSAFLSLLLSCPVLGQANFLTLRPDVYQFAKERIANGDVPIQAHLTGLLRHADRALAMTPPSVMDKAEIASGGDKHDFVCPAPLWWPDPEQADGLPYVWNREGNINPEYFDNGDQTAWDRMADGVQALAFAYYFTGEENYAAKAATLIRTWFLDAETRMNPNLNHAWFERGRNTGTPFGIRSTERLPLLLDTVGLLKTSASWESNDEPAFKDWVAAFLEWLLSSELGSEAGRLWNRFGTMYDVQVAACALFLNRPEIAIGVIEASKTERVDRHIRRDGRQPYELEREITFSTAR